MVTGLVALALAAAHSGCTRGSESEPPLCPARLPAIRSLTVDRTGVRAYPEPDTPSCAGFRPSAAQVRRFLAAAGTTDAQSADATLDRSPCQASGRVTFADGRSGRWTIEQLRVGTLTLPGRPPLLLYCRGCRERPFAW